MLIAKTCFRAFVRDNFGTFCTCQNIEAQIYELKEIWKFKEKTKWQKRQTHGNSSFGMWQYWEWVGAGKRDSIGNRLELGKRDSIRNRLELGKRDSIGNGMELGKRDSIGNGMELGKRDSIGDGLELGKRDSVGNGLELGKRDSNGDGIELGKQDSIGNRLELGKRRLAVGEQMPFWSCISSDVNFFFILQFHIAGLTPTNNKNGITKKLSDVNKKSNIQNSRPTYKNKGKHCIVLYSFFILGKKQ